MDDSQSVQLSPLERKFCCFTHNVLKCTNFNSLTFLILKCMQKIQCMYYALNLTTLKSWNSQLLTFPKYIINYVSIDYLLSQNPSIYFIILLGAVVLTLLILGLALGLAAVGEKSLSGLTRVVFSIISFILLLFKTALQLPLLTVVSYGLTIPLHPSMQADYSIEVLLGTSVLLLIVYIILQLYLICCLSDENPFSQVIYGGESTLSKILQLIYNLILVMYPIFDQERIYEVHFVIVVTILNILWVIYRHLQAVGYFFPAVRDLELFLCYLEFWFYASTTVFILIRESITTLGFIVIMTIISFNFLLYLTHKTTENSLHQNFIMLKEVSQIQQHVLLLIRIIDAMEKRQYRIKIGGYLSQHTRNCKKSESQCSCSRIDLNKKKTNQQIKFQLFGFVVDLLKSCLKRVNDQKKIQRLLSFIYQNRQKNRFQAIYSITRTLENSHLADRLEFYKQINIIETEMIEDDNKQNQNMVVDIGKFFNFNVKIVEFEDKLEKCTKDHIQFWKEMLEMNINLKKVGEYGTLITNEKDELKDYFLRLQQLNSNNAHILILYGRFLIQICNDENQNHKYLQKAELIYKNIKESAKIEGNIEKYNDNAQTTIIIISGNEHELGKIVQTNNFVHEAIGYHRREILSQNIALIMPKIFADFHNNVLARYLSTSAERFNGKERIVPVLGKDGFMKPCFALTKALPNLQKGIQIVGFISAYEDKGEEDLDVSKYSYILYDTNSQIIMGISRSCYTDFGIPVSLVYGHPNNNMNEFKVRNILSMSLEKLEEEGGTSAGQEIIVTLDTQHLQEEFMISQPQSLPTINPQPSEKTIPKTVALEIVIKSVFQLVYNSTPLRLISFYPLTEDGDPGKRPSKMQKKSFFEQSISHLKETGNNESEQLKDLKDFKNFISIKNEPSAIRLLNYSCIMLILLNFLANIVLAFLWFNMEEQYKLYVEANRGSLISRIMLSQVQFEVEKIFMEENGYGDVNANNTLVQWLVQEARNNELRFIPIKMRAIEDYSCVLDDYYVVSNGDIITRNRTIDQINAFGLTKIDNLAKVGSVYLKQPYNYHSPNVQYYLEQKYSTVFSLIPGNHFIYQQILEAEIKYMNNFRVYVYGISGFMVVCYILWVAASLPQVLSVTKINNRVMSLFSLISEEDVDDIIRCCHGYERKYLTQAVHEEGLENTGMKKSRNGSGQQSPLQTSSRMILYKKQPTKQKKQTQNQDIEEKLTAIENSQNNDKGIILCNYLIISICLLSFIFFSCFNTVYVVDYIGQEYKILYSISERVMRFREIKLTFLELLIQPDLATNETNIKIVNKDLIDKIYSIQRALLDYDYGPAQDQILATFNTKNLCSRISTYKKYTVQPNITFSQSECEQIGDGILTKGIKTTIVTSLQEIRYYLSLDGNWTKADVVERVHKYETIQKYIESPLMLILESINQSIRVYVEEEKIIFTGLSVAFIVVVLLFWKLLWRIYVNNLNEKVWRTKGMLNLIPTKIITHNQLLKNEFTSGELQKAVR